MEWLKRMTDAVDYIEGHMEERLDPAEISRKAYSSAFHFQRMFFMLTGITLAEYARKRRLTLAAQELASSDARVLDIALKYGYDTPESFSKAFRKVHGVSPSAVRKAGTLLRAYPRISFQLSLRGDTHMDYRIVEREAFTIVGKSIKVSTKDGEGMNQISSFWGECHADGTCRDLCMSAPSKPLLGICLDMDHENEAFTYVVAVEGEGTGLGREHITRVIPSSRWAVFTSVGPLPGAIKKVFERVYQEWFPATGYEHGCGPELEVYPAGDTCSDDYRCEVWIPVLAK